MRRHRSDGESITERGQEMQDSEDMAAGLLESESSLRKAADTAASSPESSYQTFVDSNLRLFTDMADETKHQPSGFPFPTDAIKSIAVPSAPSASAETPDPMQPAEDMLTRVYRPEGMMPPSAEVPETPDPMQPGIDAVENWLDERARKMRSAL